MQPCAHIRECPRCAYTQPCSDLCEALFAGDSSTCYVHHCPHCDTRMVVMAPRQRLVTPEKSLLHLTTIE